MNAAGYSILSAIIVALISLVGIFFIFLKKDKLNKIVLLFVSLAAGSLLGGTFFHLIPESFANSNSIAQSSLLILLGIIIFFIIEHFMHWKHQRIPKSKAHSRPLGVMNIISDSIHNFTDGLVIAAAYFMNIHLGIATTLVVILHEIPKEIGDLGILIYAGYSKKKALFFNFLSALAAILGVLVIILFSGIGNTLSMWVVPIAAGGFLYVAGSDLLPELHKNQEKHFSFRKTFGVILGILLMYSLTLL